MRAISLTSTLILCLTTWAQDSLGIAQRIYRFEDPLKTTSLLCYENPSLHQYLHSASLTEATLGCIIDKKNSHLDMRRGTGAYAGEACAETFIGHGSYTLWGEAFYRIGKTLDVKWNETSDMDLIYPYLTADSIGGDMSSENYFLSGGYAGRKERWNWGCEISYDAKSEYRKTDPRPKNITGLLKIKGGAAYGLADRWLIGTSFSFEKYKQTNDMLFVSETGKTEIIHLTGLGTHYNRFAGSSETSHYKGERYCLSLDFLPKNYKGITASARISRFMFTKMLTDLNRLPLCRVRHDELLLTAGWSETRWSAALEFDASRRHGTENIFGDASANVYPEIGELTMYAENRYSAGIYAVWTAYCREKKQLSIAAKGKFRHCQELYADPASYSRYDKVDLMPECRYKAIFSDSWNFESCISGIVSLPASGSIDIQSDLERPGLYRMEIERFNNQKSLSGGYTIEASASRTIKEKFAIRLRLAWTFEKYAKGVHSNKLSTSVTFSF